MRLHRNLLTAASLPLLLGVFGATTIAADAVPPVVDAAVHHRGRTPWDVARDTARKPAEIVAFSGIKPGDKVAEFVPTDGYYTRILAKLVGEKGHVYGMIPGGIAARGERKGLIAKREGKTPSVVMKKDDIYSCIMGCYLEGPLAIMMNVDYILAIENITEYKNVTAFWEGWDTFVPTFALPEQADAVFSVDGYHEQHYKSAGTDMAKLTKSIYNTMKNGATYTIADYASAKGRGWADADTLHRTDPDAVKKEILAAGFVLDGESKALANPADDHSKMADDRSDQYVLRFKKPANAANTDKRPTKAQEDTVMKNWYGNTMIFNVGVVGNVSGRRIRHTFYNEDHTYQEFGPKGSGPGPMQSGTWFWDAEGNNCMLHQYPIDERALIVCHTDVVPRPLSVVISDRTDAAGPIKIEMVPGHVLPQGYGPPSNY